MSEFSPQEVSRGKLYPWGDCCSAGACVCRRLGPGNEAVGHIVEVHQVADVGLINGEPDAGVRVKTTIRNEGKEGFLRVKARLSSSEGEWTREQKLHFDSGESKDLAWFFSEPSVNASNVQSWVEVSPGVRSVQESKRKTV